MYLAIMLIKPMKQNYDAIQQHPVFGTASLYRTVKRSNKLRNAGNNHQSQRSYEQKRNLGLGEMTSSTQMDVLFSCSLQTA